MMALVGRSLFVMILVVGATSLLAYFRADDLLDAAAHSAPSGGAKVRALIGYASLATIIGLFSTALYFLLSYVFPFSVREVFRTIGIGVMAGLALVVVLFRWRKGPATVFALLGLVVIWGLGYAILLPQVLAPANY